MDAATRDRVLRLTQTRGWFSKKRPRDGDADGFFDPDGKGPAPDRTPMPPPVPKAQKAAFATKAAPAKPQYPTEMFDDAVEPEVGEAKPDPTNRIAGDSGVRPDLEQQADELLAQAPTDPAAVQRWVVESVPGVVAAYVADDRLAALRGDPNLARQVLGRVLVDADLKDTDLTAPSALTNAVWSALWAILAERQSGEPFYRSQLRDRVLTVIRLGAQS